jgi:predicted dehydrogenase
MIQAALIGAGNRGRIYASYALKRSHEIQFIAVAEPNEERRKLFARDHNIPEDMQFTSWEELLSRNYNTQKGGWRGRVSLDNTLEARMKALKEGPYGRCVFRCDNDVVDHQVANLLFDNDVTVSFTMSGFTTGENRTFKIMGTKGEIRGSRHLNEIEIKYFNGKEERIYPERIEGGHNGSDFLIMRDFVAQLRSGELDGKTSAAVSARSHMIAYAAEHSRVIGKSVNIDEYMEQIKKGII